MPDHSEEIAQVDDGLCSCGHDVLDHGYIDDGNGWEASPCRICTCLDSDWGLPRSEHDEQVALGEAIDCEVSKVYDELTQGAISKPNTIASVVIAMHDERCWFKADNDRLEAENARLREALSQVIDLADRWADSPDADEIIASARAALGGAVIHRTAWSSTGNPRVLPSDNAQARCLMMLPMARRTAVPHEVAFPERDVPGAASTAPALASTALGGADMDDVRTTRAPEGSPGEVAVRLRYIGRIGDRLAEGRITSAEALEVCQQMLDQARGFAA